MEVEEEDKKRKVEQYIEPSKWETEYDKPLPQEILSQCSDKNCGICDVPFSSPIITKSHYDGKNHEKKVKTLLAEMFKEPENPPPKRVKAETTATEEICDPTGLFCQVCSLQCTSTVVYESHMNGKQHASKVRALSEAPGRFHCEVCNIFVNSYDILEKHQAGKAHQKKYQRSQQEQTSYRCELCNVTTSDKHGLDAHLAGARHKAKLEPDNEDGQPKRKERKLKDESETKVECNICKVMCPDMDGYNLHIEGEAHKIAAALVDKLLADAKDEDEEGDN